MGPVPGNSKIEGHHNGRWDQNLEMRSDILENRINMINKVVKFGLKYVNGECMWANMWVMQGEKSVEQKI